MKHTVVILSLKRGIDIQTFSPKEAEHGPDMAMHIAKNDQYVVGIYYYKPDGSLAYWYHRHQRSKFPKLDWTPFNSGKDIPFVNLSDEDDPNPQASEIIKRFREIDEEEELAKGGKGRLS